MKDKKDYTLEQEQIARYAKALGHPARICILNFLASQDNCFLVISMKYCQLQKPPYHSI